MRKIVSIGIVLGLAAMHAGPATALDQAVDAAIAGAGEMPGSVGYVTHSGTDVIDAQIGRWDTPIRTRILENMLRDCNRPATAVLLSTLMLMMAV